MRSSRSSEDQATVSRRLAQLTAELAAVRAPDPAGADEPANPWAAPASHTRLAAHRRPSPTHTPSGFEPAPSPVPVPGRHALRRESAWVPGPLRGEVQLGPPQLAVVAVIVVLGLAFTGWWLVRGTPEEVVAPDVPVAPPSTGGSPLVEELTQTTAAEPERVDVVVDVAGKVRRPGIAVLAPGSRVVDALEAAGGPRPGVDLSTLNLARPLVDGEQILVGVAPVPGPAAGALAGPASAAPSAGALVPLNTADQALLESLPDVGPVTAQAIVTWRDENGAFTSVDELLEVDGIGQATLARLAPLVTL